MRPSTWGWYTVLNARPDSRSGQCPDLRGLAPVAKAGDQFMTPQKSGDTTQRYWRRLSDEELLRVQFTTADPETLDGLVLEVPNGEPIVEMWYDFRGTKRNLIRCAHCKYPNHKAGFVIRTGDQRFLCGHNCGEKLYGADFHALHADFAYAKERAGLLHRMRNLHEALPSFLNYLAELKSHPAFVLYSSTRQKLIASMPRLRGALQIATEREQGRLFVEERVRDYKAERREEERYEEELREWEAETVTERKKLRKLGYEPRKPRKPLWTYERKQVGSIATGSLFSTTASPKQFVDDVAKQFENLSNPPIKQMSEGEKAALFGYRGKKDAQRKAVREALSVGASSNSEMGTLFRQIATLLEVIENQIERLRELELFFEPQTLALVARWGTANRLAGTYRAVGSRLMYEDEIGQEFNIDLPSAYAVPSKLGMQQFREAINRVS